MTCVTSFLCQDYTVIAIYATPETLTYLSVRETHLQPFYVICCITNYHSSVRQWIFKCVFLRGILITSEIYCERIDPGDTHKWLSSKCW